MGILGISDGRGNPLQDYGSSLEPMGGLTADFYHMMVTVCFGGIFGNRQGRSLTKENGVQIGD